MSEGEDLVAELDAITTYGRNIHRATVRPTHCDTCSMRMPCDWADAAEVTAAAVAELAKLRGALGEIITGTSGVAEERWEQGVDIAKAALEVTEDE